MKIHHLSICLFSFLVTCLEAQTTAQSASEIIDSAITEIGAAPWKDDDIIASYLPALKELPGDQVTSALFAALTHKIKAINQWPTIFQLGRKIENFDLGTWQSRIAQEQNPLILDAALKIMAISKRKNDEGVTAFLEKYLSDKRIGRKLEGEARGYGGIGWRICDEMLAWLWSRHPEAVAPNIDASMGPERLDQAIADYCQKFGVALTSLPEPSLQEPQTVALSPITQPPIEVPPPAKTEPLPTIPRQPWLIGGVLLITLTGLLLAILKKRRWQ